MNSTLFTDAMAVTPAGDGVYDDELNEHWTIGPKVHGGAMLALCTTVQIGQDWFDEDHIVVDSEGRIIVQSRQLAMAPPAQ
jgi:acyl-Coa thioesterase superfamily protein